MRITNLGIMYRRFCAPSSMAGLHFPKSKLNCQLNVTHNSQFVRSINFDATVGLNDDQKEYQEMALSFAENELLPNAAQWDTDKYFPKDVFRKLAELGFSGIYVSEESGGIGLGRKDSAIIFEALSTGCVSTTAYLTIHNMCCWMIDQFGNDEQRARFLPELLSFEKFSSYCLTEPNSGSDAASLSTKAELKGDEYILNGTKAFISGGGVSDIYLVMARTGEPGPKGISCFVVEKDQCKFGAQEHKLGWNCQPTCMVILENARVPIANRLGPEGEGFTYAMKALDGGRINIATTALGGAQFCLNHATEYVKDRKQFGNPLSHFQNIQFKLADMTTLLQAGRLMVHSAADMMDNEAPNASLYCSMAKRFGTDSAFNICNDSLQLLGGYGYLKDYPIERVLRDVRVHSILEGTNEIMRLIISRHILRES